MIDRCTIAVCQIILEYAAFLTAVIVEEVKFGAGVSIFHLMLAVVGSPAASKALS